MKYFFKYFHGKYTSSSSGRIYEEWPIELLEKFNLSQDFDGGVFLNEDDDRRNLFLDAANAASLTVDFIKNPILNKSNYYNFDYFRFSPEISRIHGKAINPPQGICNNQFECDFEPIDNQWGCARILKQQISLISIEKNAKFPKKEIIPIDIEFLTSTYENYFVTKKIMDIFISENITGVEFFPILSNSTPRGFGIIGLAPKSSESIREDIFQMKITGIANPVRNCKFINQLSCKICSGYRDTPEVWPPNEIKEDILLDLDLQLLRDFYNSEGKLISVISPSAVASKKIISILLENKINGFLKNAYTKWYDPIFINSNQ